MADLHAVEVGEVVVVDDGQIELQLLAGPRRGNLHGLAHPEEAAESVEPLILHEPGCGDLAPGRVVERRLDPTGLTLLEGRVHEGHLAAPRLHVLDEDPVARLGRFGQRLHLLDPLAEIGDVRERTAAGPRLGQRTAPAGLDQADGHVEVPVQLLAEEIARRREVGHVLRRADLPAAVAHLRVGERRGAGRVVDMQQTDVPVAVGLLQLPLHVRHAVGHAHLHVRLSRADPHLADEDVLQLDGPAVRNRHRVGTARRGGLHGRRPAARGIGRGLVAAAVPRSSDPHGAARCGLAPEFHVAPLLQHHVVGKDGGQLHVRQQPEGQQPRQQQKNRFADSHCLEI